MTTTTATITTDRAVDLVAHERAPRPSDGRTVNAPIVCADGFTVSVQASTMHYANDSSAESPYFQLDPVVEYPFTTFEVSADPEGLAPSDVWDEYESGGIWAWVPRQVVADMLDLHGGAVGWKSPKT